MVELQGQLMTAQRSRVTFVDVKGIEKPATLSSELRRFGAWALKLVEGVLSGMKAALEWAESQDAVSKDVAPISGFCEAGEELADAGRKLYPVLAFAMERHSTSCGTQQTVTVGKLGEF